jgi:sulfur-carrier protein
MSEKRLKLYSTLRDAVGAKELVIPFQNITTVRDMIRVIGTINPTLGAKIVNEDGELSGLVHILVHGRNIMWLQGLDTVVSDKDEIVLIPPTAGG